MAERTFLFTDIAGSTRRWQEDPDMSAVLARHDEIISGAIDANAGAVVKHTGDGVMAVFEDPTGALEASLEIQAAIAAEHWPAEPIRVRIAVHTGDGEPRAGDWFGTDVNLAARLVATAHGGQIVLTRDVQDHAGVLPPGTTVRDLGDHVLRDISGPRRILQLCRDDLPAEFPPLRSERVPVLVPRGATHLVGRDEEVRQLVGLVSTHRLVTLTGAGGTGKTRLASEVARSAAEAWPGGAHFVDLSTVTDHRMVASALADALGVHPGDGSDQASLAFLQDRNCLLLLDNCEHLLGAVADQVSRVLTSCPRVTMLLTSREALGLPDEQVFVVAGLPVADAAALFRERATAARPDWQEEPLEELCARLDGIPLAIELAAARVPLLSVRQITDRLDDRFRLLTGARRMERHQTLAATMAWSWDLLTPDESALLRRLSVFVGSFSLTAVEGVCTTADGDGPPEGDALALMGSLVAKSLVVATPDGDRTRYRLLETVRLYAAARLDEAEETERFRVRHRDWHLAWVESLPGAGCLFDYRTYPELARAEKNLRSAIECSIERGEVIVATRLVTAAGLWWQHRDGSRLSDPYFALVSRGELLEDPAHRIMALSLASMAARSDRSSSWAEAEALGARAIASAGDWEGPALAGAHSLTGVWRALRGLAMGDADVVGDGMAHLARSAELAVGHPGFEFGAMINTNTALLSASRWEDSADLAEAMWRAEAARRPEDRQPWALAYASLCLTLTLLVLGRDASEAVSRLLLDQDANRRWNRSVHPHDEPAVEFHGLMFDGFPMAVALEATGHGAAAVPLVRDFGRWMLHDPVQLADQADVFAAVGAWLVAHGDLESGAAALGCARAAFRSHGPYAKPVSVLLYRLGVDRAIADMGQPRFRSARDEHPPMTTRDVVGLALDRVARI